VKWLSGVLVVLSACRPSAPQPPVSVIIPVEEAATPAESAEPSLRAIHELVTLGDDVAAVALLRRRVTSAPRGVDPWLLLAQIYAAHDAYDAALRVLDAAACAVEPNRRWEVSYQRGLLLFQLELPDEALEELEVVRALQPYQRAGVALGEALSRDLYFWAATWIAAYQGKAGEAAQFAKAYLQITCKARDGADCDDVRQIAACYDEEVCHFGRLPVDGLTGDPDVSVHGCDRATLPAVSIENVAQPVDAMMSLLDMQRHFRIRFLRDAARSAGPVNVEATVSREITVSGGPPAAPRYLATILALTRQGQNALTWQLPTMNPAIDATLEKLEENETRRFMRGHVRIGQRYPEGLFVSPRYGIFVPERVEPAR
jgi:tetratricopeptide (TPR) repeat protein